MPERTLVNNRYMLDEPLARGGMGQVYAGRDVALERSVAVKLIRFAQTTPDDEAIRRFVREARITAQLQHPGVPAVYDIGTHEGWPYLVMQRIHGITIADLIAENGPLPIGWAAAIAAQVCATLAAAHQSSLIHRDLKPSNLMLDTDGSIKVLDFGLAVAFDRANFSRITGTGQSVGTPAYMAPEQVNAADSGPQTDLYALGCTLHEMLTGQQVFAGSTAFAVMREQLERRPRPVRDLRPDVPAELERLVLELLEKQPRDRPASAEATYRRLLPFAVDLGVLPEVLTSPAVASPLRMYAHVLSRIFAPGPGAVRHTPRMPEVMGGHFDSVASLLGASAFPAASAVSSPPRPIGPAPAAPQVASSHPPLVAAATQSARPQVTIGWRVRHSLWLLVSILGLAFASGLGLVYVGVRARRAAWWIPGLVYTVVGFVGFVLVGVNGKESAASNWGAGMLLAAWLGSIFHSALVNVAWLHWRAANPPWYATVAVLPAAAALQAPAPATHQPSAP